MRDYVVNRQPQDNGDHEVHHTGCPVLPAPEIQHYLGAFWSCVPAVIKASTLYPKANGCKICSLPCHTT